LDDGLKLVRVDQLEDKVPQMGGALHLLERHEAQIVVFVELACIVGGVLNQRLELGLHAPHLGLCEEEFHEKDGVVDDQVIWLDVAYFKRDRGLKVARAQADEVTGLFAELSTRTLYDGFGHFASA
jgi:hypothetical protein